MVKTIGLHYLPCLPDYLYCYSVMLVELIEVSVIITIQLTVPLSLYTSITKWQQLGHLYLRQNASRI